MGKCEAARPISTGQLHALLRFHLPPINPVVSRGSSGVWVPLPEGRGARTAGDLILGSASRLDAFSGYPVATWLPCAAPGGTTGTPEVTPSRSSRTRDRSPQVSYAHSR